MNLYTKGLALGCAIGSLGFGSPALAAEPPRFWAKPTVAAKVMQADLDRCTDEAKDVHATVSPPVYYGAGGGGLAGVIGSAIGAAIVASIQEHGAKAGYIRRCMHGQGYLHVTMSVDEAATYKAAKSTDAKVAWAQDLYDKAEFAQRLEAAAKPPVTLLPVAEPEPLTYAGFRLDPAKLTPASGVVVKGGQVLTGSVEHRRTARLTEDISVPWLMPAGVKKGEVFYETVMAGEDDPHQTFWCGLVVYNSLLGPRHWPTCFYNDENGYVMYQTGESFPGHVATLPSEVKPVRFATPSNLALDVSKEDLVGPMDFTLTVTKIGKAAITLEAKLGKEGKSQSVWTGNVPLDEAGKAVVPFWDHRLTLERSGAGVTATFTADGDGKSLEDIAST